MGISPIQLLIVLIIVVAMKDEENPADKLEHQKTDAADTRIIEGEARREEEKTK